MIDEVSERNNCLQVYSYVQIAFDRLNHEREFQEDFLILNTIEQENQSEYVSQNNRFTIANMSTTGSSDEQ